jgi:hypothetical protein
MKLLVLFGTENSENYGATASGFLRGLCEFRCALRVKFFFLS